MTKYANEASHASSTAAKAAGVYSNTGANTFIAADYSLREASYTESRVWYAAAENAAAEEPSGDMLALINDLAAAEHFVAVSTNSTR
jgi:hypothetical protein